MDEVPTPTQPVALSRERQIRVVLLLALATILLATLIWAVPMLWSKPATPGKAVALPPDSFSLSDTQLAGFQVATVTVKPFRSVQSTDGKIAQNADATTAVYSPYSGRVVELLANIGDQVGKGAPLFRLEATEFNQAVSDLMTASAQQALARTIEARRHASFEAKGISLQDWQQSQADLTAAEAALATVRSRLRIFGKSDAQIDALAQGGIQSDSAVYVYAPIAGVVTDRQIGPGQYLQAGSTTPVYTVGNLASVWLVANVREVDVPAIRPGQPIEVQVLALPGKTYRGKVAFVAPAIDAVTRRAAVRAVIDNPDGLLKPEMYASFDIVTGDASLAVAVPEAAVIYEGDTARVWRLNGKVVKLQQIRAGRSADGLVEVTEGLQAGDQVITSGSLFIDRAARAE